MPEVLLESKKLNFERAIGYTPAYISHAQPESVDFEWFGEFVIIPVYHYSRVRFSISLVARSCHCHFSG
jgi:hypothetical protein